MQMQTITNNISTINFTSRDKKMKKYSEFVRMNDSQLRYLSYVAAHGPEKQEKTKKSFSAMIYSLPLVAALSSGVLEKTPSVEKGASNLVNRVVAMKQSALSLGMVLLGVGLYYKVKDAISSDGHGLKKFQENHPLISISTDLAIFFGTMFAINKNKDKISKQINKAFPQVVKKVNEYENAAKAWLEKTKFNNETLPKITKTVEEFAAKYPKLSSVGKFGVANAVILTVGYGIYRVIHKTNKTNKEIDHKFYELKAKQADAAKYLLNKIVAKKHHHPRPNPNECCSND